MSFGVGALSDPMRFGTLGAPYSHEGITEGRIVSTPRIQSGQRTLVLAVAGQSNGANVTDGIYTITNTGKVDNIYVCDGGTYRYADPALGCNSQGPTGWGNWLGLCADKLINAGICDRVIWVPLSIGSTGINSWASGPLFDSLVSAGRRVAAVGLTLSAYMWVQGEAEGSTLQAAYTASLNTMIGGVRAKGIAAPWMIGVSTYHAGITNAGCAAACIAAPNGVDIFAGANTDDLGNAYRQDQGGAFVHFNAAFGRDAVAERWKNAILAALPNLPMMS